MQRHLIINLWLESTDGKTSKPGLFHYNKNCELHRRFRFENELGEIETSKLTLMFF